MSKRPTAVPNVSSAGLTEKGQIVLSISGDKLAADNRVIIDPSGYYPNNGDFDGFAFDEITISAPSGTPHTLTFDNNGNLIIDGSAYVKPIVTAPNGTKYTITVDNSGNLKTVKGG